MKKFIQPEVKIIKISSDIICTSTPLPNDKWDKDENGNLVNPGGHVPPGHNKNMWENDI